MNLSIHRRIAKTTVDEVLPISLTVPVGTKNVGTLWVQSTALRCFEHLNFSIAFAIESKLRLITGVEYTSPEEPCPDS